PQLFVGLGNPHTPNHAFLRIGVLCRSWPRRLARGALVVLIGHGLADPLGARVGALLAGFHERLGPASLAGGDLLHAAAGGDGAIARQQRAVALAFKAVAMFDQQPIVALAARI